MALLDNLVIRVKAESGQTVITDDVNGFEWNAGTGAATLVNDPTNGFLWRVTGGSRTATLSGMPNYFGVSGAGRFYYTFVLRFRISNRAGYTKYLQIGSSDQFHFGLGNGGSTSGGMKAGFTRLGNYQGPALPTIANSTVVTVVCRLNLEGDQTSYTDVWVNTAGRVGNTPDYSGTINSIGYTGPVSSSTFLVGGDTLDILDYAVFSRGLTDAEAAALADDVRGQLYTGSGADTTLPTQTGSIASSAITTTTYTASWSAGADNTAVTGYEYQINSGSWVDVGNVLTANITGRSAGTTDTFNVRCYDAAGNRSTPALTTSVMLLAAGDTTLPTQTGAITASAITTTGYSLAWPAGADNVAVTGYEYRLNSGSWIDRGTNLGATVTGRTAGATDAVEVRCYDAAGNRSTPPLTLNVTLASIVTGALVIPAVRDWETNNLKLGATGVTVDVCNISTGALVKRFTGQTTHATTGNITLNDALIIAATTYAVVTRFADGSLGVWDYTAS